MAFRRTLDVRNGVSALPQGSMTPFGKRDLKGIQPHQAWPGSTRRLLEVWEMEDSGLRVRVMKVEVARGQREHIWATSLFSGAEVHHGFSRIEQSYSGVG